LDIMPVADPTHSSEAHRYIKLQFLQQLMQTPLMSVLNPQALAMRIFKDMQIERPEELIAQPSPPPPDPKMMELQLKQQVAEARISLDRIREEREGMRLHIDMLGTQIKQQELLIAQQESDEKQKMMLARSHKDQQEANVKNRMATVAEDKVNVERQRLELQAIQQRDESRRNNKTGE